MRGDDLEAQARDELQALAIELLALVSVKGHELVWPAAASKHLAAWARRLVAESRAGALRKARAAVGKAANLGAAYAAVCAIPASAEAEPGAQEK